MTPLAFMTLSRHRCPGERPRSRHPAGPQRAPGRAHGIGVAALGNLLRAVPQQEWEGAVPAAWESGVRYFDVAPHYGLGLAERRLGLGLRGRPRNEFLISTKVGRLLRPVPNSAGVRDDEGFDVPADFVRVRDYSRDGIRRSLESSLERLGLDRVDIAFVHDPDDFYLEALDHAFPALEELRAEGMITSYGAGMNQSAMLTRFVERTDLDVLMLAGRYTLLEQGALDDLLPACLERNVSIVAAGVFNSGVLATDVPHRTATYNYDPVPVEVFASASRLAAVCNRYGIPLPAVAAQFPLGHPAIRTVCVGAYSAAQVRRNAALFEIDVPEELWSELRADGLLRADVPHYNRRKHTDEAHADRPVGAERPVVLDGDEALDASALVTDFDRTWWTNGGPERLTATRSEGRLPRADIDGQRIGAPVPEPAKSSASG